MVLEWYHNGTKIEKRIASIAPEWYENGTKIHPKMDPKIIKKSFQELKAKILKISFPPRREHYF